MAIRGGTKFEFDKTGRSGVMPNDNPLIGEFNFLSGLDTPQKFVSNVTIFLKSLGVNHNPTLNRYVDDEPGVFVLGDPYQVWRGNRNLVVSRVWNGKINGWQRVRLQPERRYDPSSIYEGYYDTSETNHQYWIHHADDANAFFDMISGMYTTDGEILLNSHIKNYSRSIVHEVFHSFEKKRYISNNTYFAEGFAEYFAGQYASRIPIPYSVYPSYQGVYEDVEKVVRQIELLVAGGPNAEVTEANHTAALSICARAFYGEVLPDLRTLLPVFDDTLRVLAPPALRLSDSAVKEGQSIHWVRDELHKPKVTEESWYVNWKKAFGNAA